VTQIIGELNEQMVGEISSSINYYLSGGAASEATNPSHVFLVGGGSRVLGLDAAIAASMQLPVQLMNPFQRVSIGGKFPIDKMMSQSHLFGVAVGL
jgi:Tfp pilus assembly PilM family ATPase